MPNENNKRIFKSWVPYWLVLLTIFLTLIPIALVLGIYLGGTNSAASYYGIDAIDVRYSAVLYYLAIASAFPLEARFFNFFSSKPYFVGCSIIYVIINMILYYSHSFAVLLVLRFVGGMLSLGFIGMIFSLVFKQFEAQRSRVLGYATMYAALFSTAPIAQLLDAFVFTKYDFNSIFLIKIYSALPGILLMCIILRKNTDLRQDGKIPLKLIRWESFILYASSLLLAAYILLYGQYYHWFNSIRITLCCIALIFFMTLFFVRQVKLAEPYINLKVYKTRNFRIGMLLLVLFYLSKGDMNLLYGFFANSVNLDIYYKGYVMLINAVGIVAGSLVSARFILAGRNIRLIWMTGFGALLGFHIYGLYILSNQAEISDLLIPLFLQGFGNGTLIISIVIFYVTSVPAEIGFSASVTGVAYRAVTFTGSMALTSYMGFHFQKIHYQSFSYKITSLNPLVTQRIEQYKHVLLQGGAGLHESNAGAMKLLGKAITNQDNLLFVRDYYLYMSAFIGLIILAIALIPHFHYHIKKIGAKLIPM